MQFEIIGDIANIETIATGSNIRILPQKKNKNQTFLGLTECEYDQAKANTTFCHLYQY